MLIWTAFIVGLFGSFHCVGMCGPIALTIPAAVGGSKWRNALLYNSGRAITYSVLGLIVGAAGYVINLSIHQGIVSVISGILLLTGFFFLASENKITRFVQKWRLMKLVRKSIGSLFAKRTAFSVFLIGMLNGLLPCGFVYVALAGALAYGDIFYSALFMFFFGAGTIPALFAVSLMGGFVSLKFRTAFKKMYPAVVTLMGMLLILRGLNLGIPYVSPQLEQHSFKIQKIELKENCKTDCCAPGKK